MRDMDQAIYWYKKSAEDDAQNLENLENLEILLNIKEFMS